MNSILDVMEKGGEKKQEMFMFVNGMQQPGDADQFMFAVTDDGKHNSYVYNRLVDLNRQEKWYFVVNQQNFVGINGLVDSNTCTCKETQNAAIKCFFKTNMVDANRFPHTKCSRDEMKKMTFLVNYVY